MVDSVEPDPPSTPAARVDAGTAALIDIVRGFADNLRRIAADTGLEHAHARHQLAAETIRLRWPRAAAVDADLHPHIVREGVPEVKAVLAADDTRLWTRPNTHSPPDRDISQVELELSMALDFANPAAAGWVRMPDLGAHIYRLALPEDHAGGGDR